MAIQQIQSVANVNAARASRSLRAQAGRLARGNYDSADELADELFRIFTSTGLREAPYGSVNLAPSITDRTLTANKTVLPTDVGIGLITPLSMIVQKKSTIIVCMSVDVVQSGVGGAGGDIYIAVDGTKVLKSSARFSNLTTGNYYTASRFFAYQVLAGQHAIKWLADGSAGTYIIQKDYSHLLLMVFRSDDADTVFKA